MEGNKKVGKVLFIVVALLVIVAISTYAWFSYRTDDTALVLTIGDFNKVQVTLSPYQINGTLMPRLTYTGGDYTEVTVVNNLNTSRRIVLYYNINNIDTALISSDFKYTIEKSTNGTNYTYYTEGDFSLLGNSDEIEVLSDIVTSTTTLYYRVYLWIDGSNSQNYIDGKVFDGELRADIGGINLPTAYQAVEYVGTTGTQYIDTGFVANQNTRFVMRIKYKAGNFIFGSDGDTGGSLNAVGLNSYNNTFRWHYDSQAYADNYNFTYGNIYDIDINKNNMYVNGTQAATFNYTSFTTPSSVIISGIRRGSSIDMATYGSSIDIYAFKIYDNGTLVRDFIPCYRKSDYVPGLYDIVNNVFYPNAGADYLVFGLDVLENDEEWVYTYNTQSVDSIITLGELMPSDITVYHDQNSIRNAVAQITSQDDIIIYLIHKLKNNTVTQSHIGFIVTDEMATVAMSAYIEECNSRYTQMGYSSAQACINAYNGETTGTYSLWALDDNTAKPNTLLFNDRYNLINAFGSSNCNFSSLSISCQLAVPTTNPYSSNKLMIQNRDWYTQMITWDNIGCTGNWRVCGGVY